MALAASFKMAKRTGDVSAANVPRAPKQQKKSKASAHVAPTTPLIKTSGSRMRSPSPAYVDSSPLKDAASPPPSPIKKLDSRQFDTEEAHVDVAALAEVKKAELDAAARAQAALENEKAELAEIESTPEERELEDAMEEGIDLRSKWGVRFSRDKEGGKHPTYTNLASRAAKAQFRKDWAKSNWQQIRKMRERRDEFSQVDIKKGTYKPFSMIWKKQGGTKDPFAMEAAKNYTAKCIAMKGNWLKYNKMTCRMEYLDIDECMKDVFTRSWAMYEQKESVPQSSTATPAENLALADKKATATPKNKARPSAHDGSDQPNQEVKPQAKCKATPKKEPTTKKAQLDAGELAKAVGIKSQYASVMMSATGVANSINTDATWEWAKGTRDHDELGDAIARVSAAATPFCRYFTTVDIKEVRKDYKNKEQILEKDLSAFVDAMSGNLKSLSLVTRRIVAMHGSRCAVA